MEGTARPFWRSLYFWVLAAIALGVLVGWLFPPFGRSLEPLGLGFVKLVKMIISPSSSDRRDRDRGMADLKAFGAAGEGPGLFLAVRLWRSRRLIVATSSAGRGARRRAGEPRCRRRRRLPGPGPRNRAWSSSSSNHSDTLIRVPLHVRRDPPGSVRRHPVRIALAMLGEKGERLQAALKTLTALMFRIVHLPDVPGAGRRVRRDGLHHRPIRARLARQPRRNWSRLSTRPRSCRDRRARADRARRRLLAVRTDVATSGRAAVVLGTSSSESALPLLIEKLERAGCPNRSSGWSCQQDIRSTSTAPDLMSSWTPCSSPRPADRTFGAAKSLMGVAMISSKGAAGVTGSGFIVLATTWRRCLRAGRGHALILGIDRFMSECRALTTSSQCVATIVGARWKGRRSRPASRRVPREAATSRRPRATRCRSRGKASAA